MLSGFDKFTNKFAELNIDGSLDFYFDMQDKNAFETIQGAIRQIYFSLSQVDMAYRNYEVRQILCYQDFMSILVNIKIVRDSFYKISNILLDKEIKLPGDIFLSKGHNEQYESLDDSVYFDFLYDMIMNPMDLYDVLDTSVVFYPLYESVPAVLSVYGFDADADVRLYKDLSDEDEVVTIPLVLHEFNSYLNAILFKFTIFRNRLTYIVSHKDEFVEKFKKNERNG